MNTISATYIPKERIQIPWIFFGCFLVVVPEDYVFDEIGAEGAAVKVRLSELFADKPSLIIYNMMFPRHKNDGRAKAETGVTAALPREDGPCPSCVGLLDQFDGVMRHLRETHSLVIVAKTPAARLAAFAQERGWKHLRLLSSAGNDFKRQYGGEDADGQQQPMMNVFQRTPEGIRHFWSSEMLYAPGEPGQDPRALGTVEPLWTLQDFTPEGRAMGWDEQLQYGCCC